MLEAVFELLLDSSPYDKDTNYDKCVFVAQNPSCIDIYREFGETLKKHRTIRLSTLQSMLSCSKEKAQLCLDHLIDSELVEEFDNKRPYFVIQSSIGGLIPLLKIMRDLGEQHLAENNKHSETI